MTVSLNITLNIVGICIVLMLYIIHKHDYVKKTSNIKLFRILLCLTFCQCLLETISYFIEGKNFILCHELLLIINSALFFLSVIFSLTWLLYVEYRLFYSIDRLKNKSLIFIIPLVVIGFGSFLNLFLPIFFGIDQNNYYYRTTFSYIAFIINYSILVYTLIIVVKAHGHVDRYITKSISLFLTPVLIGIVLQVCFYGISLIWISTAISLVAIYGNIQNEMIYIDGLSGLYNRQFLTYRINKIMTCYDSNKLKAGIMLDIDRFKSINDTYGHIEGDNAIVQAANILKKAVKPNDYVIRYGGDEFLIFMEIEDKKEIINVKDKIDQLCFDFNINNGTYRLNFSMGEMVYNQSIYKEPFDFIKELDARMYEDKKNSNI